MRLSPFLKGQFGVMFLCLSTILVPLWWWLCIWGSSYLFQPLQVHLAGIDLPQAVQEGLLIAWLGASIADGVFGWVSSWVGTVAHSLRLGAVLAGFLVRWGCWVDTELGWGHWRDFAPGQGFLVCSVVSSGYYQASRLGGLWLLLSSWQGCRWGVEVRQAIGCVLNQPKFYLILSWRI